MNTTAPSKQIGAIMTVYSIKNSSELKQTLAKAKGGDVLKLAGGNYGDVTISKSFASNVTITSANEKDPAVFKHMMVKNASNLTLDDLSFKGGVNGRGLEVYSSANINVADSDFRDTWFGATFVKTSNLKVSDNFFTDLWHDAMRFVAVTNADITGNTYIEKGSEPGYPHKDFMQFWTNKANGEGPSKNVTITGNTFVSDDGYSHGIFILSEDNSMGKHQNFVIADNIIKSSQVHAITVDYTDNLTIKNNLIEQYGKGSTPVINVSPDSTNVNIIKNTAPSVPDQGNSTWTVSGNKETVKNAYHWTDGKTGTKVVNTGQPVGANTGEHTAPGNSGDGKATEFRFDGSDIKGTKASTVNNVNFSEGDTFVFIWYDEGTLADKDGGNLVWNNKSATYAKIDSIVDLQEIVAFSDKISSKVVGDDIILSIKQDSGVHNLTVTGLGHEFQSTWNDALF